MKARELHGYHENTTAKNRMLRMRNSASMSEGIAVLIVAYATGRSESDQKTRERSSLIATFARDHHRSVIICA